MNASPMLESAVTQDGDEFFRSLGGITLSGCFEFVRIDVCPVELIDRPGETGHLLSRPESFGSAEVFIPEGDQVVTELGECGIFESLRFSRSLALA